MSWGREAGRGDRRRLVSMTVCVAALLAGSAPALAVERKWQPWAEFGAVGSSDLSRGEAVLFFPLTQDADTLTFFEGTGRVFQDDIREGNLAFGIRQILDRGVIVGGWAGFDVRRTRAGNTFNQVSLGVEAMTDRFDARLNGYFPTSDAAVATGSAEAVQQGSRIFITSDQEIPLGGFDGEIGVRLFESGMGGGLFGDARQELRVYGGGYYFDDDAAPEAIAGPRVRAEYRIDDVFAGMPGSRLTAEARFQTDDVRGDQWSAGLSLRIPLGARGDSDALARRQALSPLERRMTERLVRDPDIVTTQGTVEEDVRDTETGVAFERVAEVGAGDDLTTVAADAGENTLLIADGGTRDGANTLQDNQTLMGGGATIMVTGASTGQTLPFTAPGSRPTFRHPDPEPVLTIGRNNHVGGVGIEGFGTGFQDGNHGIFGQGDLGTTVLTDNRISGTGDQGIFLETTGGRTKIADNTLTDTRDDAIQFRILLDSTTTSSIEITGNTIADGGTAGIDVDALDGAEMTTVVVADNTISGKFEGMDIDFDPDSTFETVTIHNNTLDEGNIGFSFESIDAGSVTVSENVITGDDAGSSLRVTMIGDAELDRLTVRDNTVVDARRGAMRVSISGDTRLGSAIIDGNTIRNAGEEGYDMSVGGQVDEIAVTGNTIETTGEQGVNVRLFGDASVSDFRISGNTVTGTSVRALNMETLGAATGSFRISGNQLESASGAGAIRIQTRDTSDLELEFSDNTVLADNGRPLFINLANSSSARIAVTGNQISGGAASPDSRVLAGATSALDLQFARNTLNAGLELAEGDSATFRLEDLLGTNTLPSGTTPTVDPDIDIVPAGTFFPVP